MKKKLLLVILLAALLAVGAAFASAEEYYTDIQLDVRALDKPTPVPETAPSPSPTSAPAPTPSPTAPLPCEIEVDLANQVVTVYRGSGRSEGDVARQMICSSGVDDETPVGTFIMPEIQKEDEREAWYYIGKYRLHVQYASRIVDSILFHSLPSERAGTSPTMDSVEMLGQRASHGCIRLRPADSRWIAENCPPGTPVHIFEGGTADEPLRKRLLESSFVSEEMSYAAFLGGKNVYSIGSKAPEVAAAQAKLRELGFILTETDGFFGADTHACVLEWQLENGCEGTGELNEAQLDALTAQEYDPMRNVSRSRPARVKVKDALSLRSEPSSKSEKLTSLHSGTIVRVLAEADGWYEVRVGSLAGYVGGKYIEFIEDDTEVN